MHFTSLLYNIHEIQPKEHPVRSNGEWEQTRPTILRFVISVGKRIKINRKGRNTVLHNALTALHVLFLTIFLQSYTWIHLPQFVLSFKRKWKHQPLRVTNLFHTNSIVLAQKYKGRSHLFLLHLLLTDPEHNNRRGNMHCGNILKGNNVHNINTSYKCTCWIVFRKLDGNRLSMLSINLTIVLFT